MGNLATLRPNVFSKDNQPANAGRKPGIPNRATVYRKILESKMRVKMPGGDQQEVTVYEAVALGQIKAAINGNTNAWKEIQDTLHGKMPNAVQPIEVRDARDVAIRVVAELIAAGRSEDEARAYVMDRYGVEDVGPVE